MATSSIPLTGRRIVSVMWFPVLFAIALPVIFEVTFHAPQPHEVQIAVVGSTSRVEEVRHQLHAVSSGGFEVKKLPSQAKAMAAVRDETDAAAFVDASPANPKLYVARAASAIRATYLQGVFTQIAVESRTAPPQLVDLVPLLPGDSNAGVFFFMFPMMMIGVISVLVFLQRAPAWLIGRRVVGIAAMGALGAVVAYLTSVNLNVLPDKPVLLLYAFLVSQVFGQLMVGLAPLLKQYFMPVAMTFSLVLSVPSSGGTVPNDLLPTGVRYLSDVFPLAQGVKITRSVAFFHGIDLLDPTLILVAWAVVALIVVGVAQYKRPVA
jgi:hypothetical protein